MCLHKGAGESCVGVCGMSMRVKICMFNNCVLMFGSSMHACVLFICVCAEE